MCDTIQFYGINCFLLLIKDFIQERCPVTVSLLFCI